MFLDPEVIARSLLWRDHAGVKLNRWSRVVASLGLPAREQACVVEELGQFAQTVSELPRLAAEAGVEPEVIAACMRQASRLTQPEFAKHRNISVAALRQIETGSGNPTMETLNKIASIFGLEVGFVPKRRPPS